MKKSKPTQFRPVNAHLLVQPPISSKDEKADEKNIGGIIVSTASLSHETRQALECPHVQATVLAVADDCVRGIKPGDKVITRKISLFRIDSGVTGQEHLLLAEKDVFLVVK